jgi:hypothetical protein
LDLEILNPFDHSDFSIKVSNDVNIKDYGSYVLGVYQPKYKIKIVEALDPNIDSFINVIHNGLDISKMSTLGRGLLINSKGINRSTHNHRGFCINQQTCFHRTSYSHRRLLFH